MLDQSKASNHLFARMAPNDFIWLRDRAAVIELPKGLDLALAGDLISHGWFPEAGMISVIASNAGGDEAEIGLIGIDGFAHTALILGGDKYNYRLLVQIAGTALRIEREDFRAAMAASPHLTSLMLLYVEAFSAQAASSALAFARRTIVERLARWLLMSSDRVGDEVSLTHDALAIMLGIRRAGVTNALASLAERGLIGVGRGRQRILDRTGLMQRCGGSYGDAEAEARRLLGRVGQGSTIEKQARYHPDRT